MQFQSALIAHQPDVALSNSDASALTCLDKSLAVQEMTDDCDINRIVETWVKTGIAPQSSLEALSGDFSQVDDYRTMLDKINRAKREFMTLDADTRSYFKNDPANLISALDDPTQTSKLIEFGIKKAPPAPVSVPAVDAGSPQ